MAAWARKWVPDPFVLAVLLTFLSFVLAVAVAGFGFVDALGAWGGRILRGEITNDEVGLWKFLAFAMQMCLILVTGHALAATKPVGEGIRRLAAIPRSTGGAAALTSLAAMLTALLNWGLGLIVGALLAREIGLAARREGRKLHYPLVAASGYLGLMIWHGGLSGTAPLKMTQTKDVAEILGAERAAQVGTLGLDQTIFHPMNLAVSGLLLLAVPLLFWRMAPRREEEMMGIEVARLEEAPPERREEPTPASRLEDSPLLCWVLCAMGFGYLALYLGRIGLWKADVNAINLLFLFLGLMLHGSVGSYLRAVNEAVRGCGGILLQFPFYAGIQAVLHHSGLIRLASEWVAANSSEATLPLFTFLSAALVNLFIPSGGGQWAVQGPVVVDSARQLGAPLGPSIMALAYGDEWTNMLQPFWALPLLSLTGLKARDIIGYTALAMALTAPCFVLPLLLLH